MKLPETTASLTDMSTVGSTVRGTRTWQELVHEVPKEVVAVFFQELPSARILETKRTKIIFALRTR